MHDRTVEHLLTEWDAYYTSKYEQGDSEQLERTLRETLRIANEPENILDSHGLNIVGPIKIGVRNEYPGADFTIIQYSRNLHIFANLQRITEPPDERRLLIIAGGHIPILRHCVEASQEYQLIEIGDYL